MKNIIVATCLCRSTCSFGGKDWNVRKKRFSTQQWVHGYVFHWDKLYDKKFIFKADSINLASVEEVPFVDGIIVR
jgi:hypothetical protein